MNQSQSSSDEYCEIPEPKNVKQKKMEVINGYLIKYHANGITQWSKGKIEDGQPDGY